MEENQSRHFGTGVQVGDVQATDLVLSTAAASTGASGTDRRDHALHVWDPRTKAFIRAFRGSACMTNGLGVSPSVLISALKDKVCLH